MCADNELTLAEYRGIIDDLIELGTFCIVFTGGEPLLRDDFFDIVAYAREKGFLTVLFTNGSRIDDAMAERIAEANFWQVEISLHGATAATHDRITGKSGSYAKTIAAVKMLRKHGVTVNLKSLLTRLNVKEQREMASLARSLGTRYRFDIQINPRLDGSLEPLDLALSTDDIKAVLAAAHNRPMAVFG